MDPFNSRRFVMTPDGTLKKNFPDHLKNNMKRRCFVYEIGTRVSIWVLLNNERAQEAKAPIHGFQSNTKNIFFSYLFKMTVLLILSFRQKI